MPLENKRRRTDPNLPEAVFPHEMSKVIADEFLHALNVDAIIDLTLGPSTWAIAAVENSIPYFGIALSEKHHEQAFEHIGEVVDGMMKDESNHRMYLGGPKTAKPKRQPTAGGGKSSKKKPKKEADDEDDGEGQSASPSQADSE